MLPTAQLPINPDLVEHSGAESKRLLHKLVRQAITQQAYRKAIRLLNCLITQEPQNPSNYNNRGLMYYHCRCWSQAMADYNRAIQLNLNRDKVYTNRAKCNVALGQWSDAIADYDSAIDINPHNIKARIRQGVLFRDLKMYDDAIVCFGLALFLGKLSAHVYGERGRTHQLNGHWNCAIGDYQRALGLLNTSPNQSLERKIRAWISELLD